MATANFKTMNNFPLIVAGNSYVKVCPDCGITNADDADACEDCGCNLADVSPVYDEFGMKDLYDEMKRKADELNEYLTFYTVSVESGYYSGLQFYVDDKYYHIEEMDNEESQDEFGMCRSKMLRKFKSETNWLCRALRKARADLGLMELACTARFSNGEAVYTRVDVAMSAAAQVKVAAKAAMAA